MDRRAGIFLVFSVACFALYPLADEYDGADGWHLGSDGWAFVAVVLGVVYALLAVLSWLDHRSRLKLRPRPLGYERTGGPPRANDSPDAPDRP
jgi:hypothetical protein